MSEITECQIIFRRDGIIIKKVENLPLVGRKEIMEKIDYSQLEGKILELTIKSIRKLTSNGEWELIFDVISLKEITRFKDLKRIEIEIPSESYIKYGAIPIPTKYRHIFPGYKEEFVLETDIGEVRTYISSAPKDTEIGDPMGGRCITKGLREWFKAHKDEIKPGTKVVIEVVEPMRRYKLYLK